MLNHITFQVLHKHMWQWLPYWTMVIKNISIITMHSTGQYCFRASTSIKIPVFTQHCKSAVRQIKKSFLIKVKKKKNLYSKKKTFIQVPLWLAQPQVGDLTSLLFSSPVPWVMWIKLTMIYKLHAILVLLELSLYFLRTQGSE